MFLQTNTSLRELDLTGNSIRDAGMKALGDALKANSALTSLSIKDNEDFGTDGAKALGEGLKVRCKRLMLRTHELGFWSKGKQVAADAARAVEQDERPAACTCDQGTFYLAQKNCETAQRLCRRANRCTRWRCMARRMSTLSKR